jgi:hypothetical protein
MFKSYARVAGWAAFFLVSGCGGGGAGSGIVTQPPPPKAPEAFPLTASAEFQTIAGHMFFTDNSKNLGSTLLSDVGVGSQPSGVTIGYDATSGNYLVGDGTSSATFSGNPVSSTAGIDTYTSQSGTVTNQLDLFSNVRPGASQADAPVALTYLSFAKWTSADSASGDDRITYLLFGFPTDSSEMPRTGTASYNTAVTGTSLTGCFACVGEPFGGSATFTADFGAGSVSTALDLTDSSGTIGSFQGTGSISGDQFAGNFTGTFTQNGTALQDGSFDGGFFGPAAAEMGYTFALHRHVLDPFAGASIEPDSWFLGVVVGTKK